MSKIICPHCGEDLTDKYTGDPLTYEGYFRCACCGGLMDVEMDVAVNYKVTPVFEEE